MIEYIIRGNHVIFEPQEIRIKNDVKELITQIDCLYEMGFEITVDTIKATQSDDSANNDNRIMVGHPPWCGKCNSFHNKTEKCS